MPGPDDVTMRNEGVRTLLDEWTTAAWRDAGKEWKVVSLRIVVVG